MAGIGIILTWLGYSVAYYGYNLVTGGNDSFVSLIWPGRYTPTPRDGPSGPTTAQTGLPSTEKPNPNPTPSGSATGGTNSVPPAGLGSREPTPIR